MKASHPCVVIARREVRLLARDPMPLVLLLVVPLAFVAFLKPALFITLVIEGFPGSNGAEQAVPGAATTFSLFLTGLVGLSFFREHGWGTWDRLRASPASTRQILVGKLAPLLAFSLVQITWIFTIGVVAFGLRVRGSPVALAVLTIAVSASHVAMGLLLIAFARTIQQVNALANLGTALLAGIGGAIVPAYLLPEWVRAISPCTPTYWAMRGYRTVLLDGRGLSGVTVPAVVLIGFAIGLFAVAAVRFSIEEAKSFWS